MNKLINNINKQNKEVKANEKIKTDLRTRAYPNGACQSLFVCVNNTLFYVNLF